MPRTEKWFRPQGETYLNTVGKLHMTSKACFFYTAGEERRRESDDFSYHSLYQLDPAQPAKAVQRIACLASPPLHLKLFCWLCFFT